MNWFRSHTVSRASSNQADCTIKPLHFFAAFCCSASNRNDIQTIVPKYFITKKSTNRNFWSLHMISDCNVVVRCVHSFSLSLICRINEGRTSTLSHHHLKFFTQFCLSWVVSSIWIVVMSGKYFLWSKDASTACVLSFMTSKRCYRRVDRANLAKVVLLLQLIISHASIQLALSLICIKFA